MTLSHKRFRPSPSETVRTDNTTTTFTVTVRTLPGTVVSAAMVQEQLQSRGRYPGWEVVACEETDKSHIVTQL